MKNDNDRVAAACASQFRRLQVCQEGHEHEQGHNSKTLL
jgi:hypothetical protein